MRLGWPDGRCASFRIAASRRIWNHLQITAGPASGHDGTDSAAHNVLAAEAFALPLADPAIRPRPVVLPDDPTGIGQPHDVLAAEEFAMPAVGARAAPSRQRGGLASRPWPVAAGIVLLAILLRRRRS